MKVSGDVVRVNVRVERELTILGLAGIGPMTVEAEGAARAVQGVQRGGD